MKARFLEPQLPVKVVKSFGMAYIFICLNETQKTETYPDMEDGNTSQAYYEYDYNEIIGPEEKLPIEEIQLNPENYLDYKYCESEQDPGIQVLTEIEELKAAIERGLTT